MVVTHAIGQERDRGAMSSFNDATLYLIFFCIMKQENKRKLMIIFKTEKATGAREVLECKSNSVYDF